MKKLIAFDLDGTLAESKSAMTDGMAELLRKLLEKYEVCVISGGNFAQFEKQLVANLHAEEHQLARLHLMPTCGTRYLRFDDIDNEWRQIYAEDIDEKDRKKIAKVLEDTAKDLNLYQSDPQGDIIEDRGSQITFSALGQKAPADKKHAWDPDGSKKMKLRDAVAPQLPDFEVRTGGSTSIDITKLGIDKAYGMQKIKDAIDVSDAEILFVGDALQEGGNDYPVKAMGIDSIQVSSWQTTLKVIETILKVGN